MQVLLFYSLATVELTPETVNIEPGNSARLFCTQVNGGQVVDNNTLVYEWWSDGDPLMSENAIFTTDNSIRLQVLDLHNVTKDQNITCSIDGVRSGQSSLRGSLNYYSETCIKQPRVGP